MRPDLLYKPSDADKGEGGASPAPHEAPPLPTLDSANRYDSVADAYLFYHLYV